ncbi:cation:proton antiporter [Desulfolithobacter dissulfuricans]|uniref:Cation:proton antiporter n=1 Tax=Desulfolithobacter dissulfuricans TaxID=2795293 RepID=A0A915U3L8_9BACT|nr:monovalent cation/H+ antiporter subunit D family protein [Desulfolithobacter dissulfuricans]BCO10741.1 cation:proton antiporter [Desulfolithobacter dissulfuricans]
MAEQTTFSILPVLIVAVSLVGAGLIMRFRHDPNRRETVSVVTGVLKFALVMAMLPPILRGEVLRCHLVEILPGFSLVFRVDGFSMVFASISSFLWILTSFYSIGYMRGLNEHAQTRYYTCFALTLSAALGVAMSGSLFTMYLFYELVSIFTYPLVMHHEDHEARWGANKYLVYLMGTGKLFFLTALVLTYVLAGNLDFGPDAILPADADPTLLVVLFILFVAGIAKSGLIPLHSWLPSAMVAPTPVSALLHAVAVVKVGVFCIARVIYNVYGPELMQQLGLVMPTAFFMSATILLASMIALTHDNLKARLAYSTVSQLAYITLGFALVSVSSMTGGMIHIANHAFSKITLFYCAGAIFVASGKKYISELSGIGYRMPITMTAFAIGAFSMIGVPGTAGFVTKWFLGLGCLDNNSMLLLVFILTSSLLNAGYFLPIIYRAFFMRPSTADKAGLQEAPAFMVIPLSITAGLTILFGLFPQPFLQLIGEVLS